MLTFLKILWLQRDDLDQRDEPVKQIGRQQRRLPVEVPTAKHFHAYCMTNTKVDHSSKDQMTIVAYFVA